MLDDNLKQHCQEVHGKTKLFKGQKTLLFSTTQEEPPKKKDKSDNGEKLGSSCIAVQAEESGNSANTLNIESISKSENSVNSQLWQPRQLKHRVPMKTEKSPIWHLAKHQSWILNSPMK